MEFFDEHLSGFLLEVRPSGRKTYAQRYTDHYGRQHQYKIGDATIISLGEAKQIAKQVLSQVILGSNPQDTRKNLRTMPTLTQFVHQRYYPYIESYKISPHIDEGVFRRYILPFIGSRPMAEVQTQDVLALMASMKKRGLGPASIQRTLQVLRYAYSLAIKRWRIPGLVHNPTEGIKEPVTPKRTRYLSEDELQRLLNTLQGDRDQRAAQAAILILLTGARRMEILGARWEWVDHQKATLLVPRSKNGKPRHIVLNDRAIQLIGALPRQDNNPYLFPHPRTGLPYPIEKSWNRIRKAAQLPDLRIHDLRHSFASFLVNQNVSLYVVKDLLGHASISTTQRYAHLTQGTKKQAVELVTTLAPFQSMGSHSNNCIKDDTKHHTSDDC